MNRNIRFFLLLLILFCIPLLSVQAAPPSGQRDVLMLDKGKTGVTYSINGNPVEKSKGLLLSLSELRNANSTQDPELIMIVSGQLKFEEVTDLMGLAGKARYYRFQVFVFDKDKHTMYQLTYSKGMPFSASGNPEGPPPRGPVANRYIGGVCTAPFRFGHLGPRKVV